VAKTGFLPETDRETFKDSAMRCMWFIRETDLLLARTDPKPNWVCSDLQELNNAIWRFNNEELNAGNRLTNFLDFYNVWKAENDGDIHSYLERLLSAAGTFLFIVISLLLLCNMTESIHLPHDTEFIHMCFHASKKPY